MNIVVDIGHPAHVHFFKNFIWDMRKKGHKVLITALDKEVTLQLLDEYGFEYVNLGCPGKNLFTKILSLPVLNYKMWRAVRGFSPSIFIGIATIRGAQIARLLGKRCIVFDDTEPSPQEQMLYLPFTDKVLTPECFRKDLGKKQVRYKGYHELAYLHPKYFQPDPSVLEDLGVEPGERYFLLRFIAWKATHDVGRKGFDLAMKKKVIEKLEQYGKVFVSSEGETEEELKKYEYRVAKNKMMDALYFAQMVVTESQTMATEAALLGTPALRYNSFVGPNDMGNFIELEQKYDLLYSFNNFDSLYQKVEFLLAMADLKEQWKKKRELLLEEKIDVTQRMVELIECAV